MKKRVLMVIFLCIFFNDVVAMKNEHPLFGRVGINDQDDSRLSTEIVAYEKIDSAARLIAACQDLEGLKELIDNHIIKSQALAGCLWLVEARHQAVDINVLRQFEELEQESPVYFAQCIEDLAQEILLQQNSNKKENLVLVLQQQMRQNNSEQYYQLKGLLSQVAIECADKRKNYHPYLVRNTLLSTLSLGLFSGIVYFSWALYHCSL